MKQVLKCHVMNFAQADLQEMVSPDTIQRIKMRDPNPVFKAYVIAHEGDADGTMIGAGRTVFKWFRDAIYKVGNSLGFGTAAFYRHEGNDGTGNNSGREAIGEVVGKAFKEIGGKLHAIAAVYVLPKFRDRKLEAASIEANIEYSMQDGDVRVDTVERITGLALSDMDRPAFPGATLLASMQAFEKTGSGRTRQKGAVDMSENISLAEVKAFIKNGNYSPLDFFKLDDIMEVPKVKNTFEKAERVETDNKELKSKMEKADEAHKKELEGIRTQAVTAQAETIFATLAKERNLSTQQVAYSKKNFSTFKSEAKDPEALKTDLQKFVDVQIKDYDGTLTAIGLKPAEHGGTGAPPPTETEEQKAARLAADGVDKGAGGGDKEAAAASGVDLSDPKNNDLIPK